MEIEKGIEKGILERFKIPKEEIHNVLDVIDNQVEKSRKDGLIIMEKDLVLEKFYFLCVIEQWGGFKKTKRDYSSDFAAKELEERIKTFFHYFNLENNVQDEMEKEKNKQVYIAHLEEVKKGIISLIFEDKI